MKKAISLVIILMLFVSLLTSCDNKFNIETTIKELKDAGLTEIAGYSTEEELVETNDFINSAIEFMGGDFTVTVTEYYSLIQDNNRTKCVEFVVFSTVDEATAYANLYASQPNEMPAKIAQSNNILIITNLAIVEETVNLVFS